MKKLFIFGITCFIAGCIFFSAGMSMLDWRFLDLDTEEYVKKEYFLDESVQAAEINQILVTMSLSRIKISRGSELKIVYYESENDTTSIACEGGVLSVTQTYFKKDRIVTFFNGLKRAVYATEIIIPDGVVLSLDVSTKNSRIEATSPAEFIEVRLKSTNGDIDAENITAESVWLETTNGGIEAENITAENVWLETTNGSVEAEDIFSANDIRIKTKNGSVDVSEVSAEYLSIKTTNARIKLEDVTAGKVQAETTNSAVHAENVTAEDTLTLVSKNGSIRVVDVLAQNLVIKTSNADVTGTIRGEKHHYNIDADTTNGSNNLKDNSVLNGNNIYIRTTNGSIKITFSGH